MDPEPGEQVFFHGHPSWRSMLAFHLKGLAAAIALGALAGVVSRLTERKVEVSWVALAVFVYLVAVVLIGLVRRIWTTYTITDQRLTIDHGLLSRDVHETRLERVQNVNSCADAARTPAADRHGGLRHRRQRRVRLRLPRRRRTTPDRTHRRPRPPRTQGVTPRHRRLERFKAAGPAGCRASERRSAAQGPGAGRMPARGSAAARAAVTAIQKRSRAAALKPNAFTSPAPENVPTIPPRPGAPLPCRSPPT